MPIRYHLVENRLTDDPNDYYALVETIDSLDLDAIAARMAAAGSTVTEADIRAVFIDFVQELKAALAEGNRVNIGDVVSLYPSISGVFEGADATFNSGTHTINLNANPAPGVVEYLRQNARPEKTEAVKPAPVLLAYLDLATGTTNAQATPGTIGTINGSRLKFNADKADEGIFFVPATTGDTVRVTAIQKNKPSQLVFLVPTLTSGSCRLEVRARMQGKGDVRTGALDKNVTVA